MSDDKNDDIVTLWGIKIQVTLVRSIYEETLEKFQKTYPSYEPMFSFETMHKAYKSAQKSVGVVKVSVL